MAIQATNYDATKEYDVAEMSDLYNDNLLLNSEFRYGAINQQGKTQYTNTSYTSKMTVDGWFTDYGSVNVFANSVYFDNNGSTEYGFKQPLSLPSDTYTFYIDCAVKGNARVFARNADNGEVINQSITGTVKKSFTFTNSLKFITIIASAGTKISFNFMKLEKGSHFTGMPTWNQALEINKCLSKYEIVNFNITRRRPQEAVGKNETETISYYYKSKTPSVTVRVVGATGVTYRSVNNIYNNRAEILIDVASVDTAFSGVATIDCYDY